MFILLSSVRFILDYKSGLRVTRLFLYLALIVPINKRLTSFWKYLLSLIGSLRNKRLILF